MRSDLDGANDRVEPIDRLDHGAFLSLDGRWNGRDLCDRQYELRWWDRSLKNFFYLLEWTGAA